jgi:uncharacterized protein (TIGR03435 family)
MQNRQRTFECRKNNLMIVACVVTLCLPVVFGLLSAHQANAQQQPQAQTAPAAAPPVFEYDVASIKLNISGGPNMNSAGSADSFTISNTPVKALIQSAYGVQNYQILGAPDWLTSEKYDINAKLDVSLADAFRKLGPADRSLARQHMMQALLADRFALKIHRETKELPVYTLIVVKSGHKLKEAKPADGGPDAPPLPASSGSPSIRNSRTTSGPATLTFLHTSSADLAATLATEFHRTVVDKTGLTFRYDFTLQFMPDDAPIQPSSSAVPADLPPSIFTAIQDQLGLKLESGKGPVEVIVIDHVERPSGN